MLKRGLLVYLELLNHDMSFVILTQLSVLVSSVERYLDNKVLFINTFRFFKRLA